MANSKSAAKRARQSSHRALRNRRELSRLRSLGKRGPKADTQALISALDKAAKRGVIHRNAARRRKARLHKAATKNASAA